MTLSFSLSDDLASMDGRLADALDQLREQQGIVPTMRGRRKDHTTLKLLSHGLRQFHWIERQRNLVALAHGVSVEARAKEPDNDAAS